MKRILFAIAALLAVVMAAPANAQIIVGPTSGVGVQVGPLAVGVWPDYWGYRSDWRGYAYVPECRVVRTRIITRHGEVIWRTRRVCD